PAARTRPLENTLAITGKNEGFTATHTLDEPLTLPPASAGAPASTMATGAKPSERVDFDVTSQFAESTMSINLDANDPVSEADFHLAYGLYDEAALLLKQAAEKDPKRTELRVKLAETYFAASRPQEFLEVAGTLKNEMPTAEWQKLAIMGRQLCPDAALFKGADESAALGGDVDLSFDEPSAPATPAPAPRAAAPAPKADAGLDFKLEELELSQLEPTRLVPRETVIPSTPPPPPPPPDDDGALDFKLEDIELKPSTEPGSELSAADMGHSIDFNATIAEPAATPAPLPDPLARTGGFSSKTAETPSFEEIATATAVMTDGPSSKKRSDEVSLDDFDLGDDSAAISSGDEAGTKLDLARAYADMGDNDMAKTLLKEVVESGNAEQKKEAQALIGRLG
ncbi:MAG TPA: FimV/HubP family polar landmark protein, partial [Nevskiaceae bacterium]|nr:FimV/HubP family polar landmark protein [Nevskiaceae bacterium]